MKNTFDFYMGGRKTKGICAGISAQTAGLGMWLLIILPGYVYFFGAGQAWIAIGLFLGTYVNWHLISARLRRYAVKAGNAKTLPEYLKNRFHDKSGLLMGISSVIIIFFLLFYIIVALGIGGRVLEKAIGMDYSMAVLLISVFVFIYLSIGGLRATDIANLVQGILVLLAAFTIPVIISFTMSAAEIINNIINSGAEGSASIYLNIFYEKGERMNIIQILSQLSWGFGICGFPNIIVKLMSVADENELKIAKRTAVIWSLITIVAVCVLGALGRAYLYPEVLDIEELNNILFIDLVEKLFNEGYIQLFTAGILICGILSSIMSAADSQLLSVSSSVTEDLLRGIIFKKMSEKSAVILARVTLFAGVVITCAGAMMARSSLIPGMKNIWSGLGSAFAPVIIMSLYWKRMNKFGAAAGMLGGVISVFIWDNLEIIQMTSGKATLFECTQISSVLVGFLISFSLIILVSIFTGDVNQDVKKEFDEVKNRIN